MPTTVPTKPSSGADWNAYGAALDTALRELQSAVATLQSGATGLTIGNATSSLTVRKRPVLISGLTSGSGADNTSVLNSAFAAAQPYDTLVVPAGDWYCSAASTVLEVPPANPNVRIEGQGRLAHIISTVPRYGGFRVRANGTELAGLKHTVIGATARGNGENYDDCPFSFWNCTDVLAEDLVSTGSRDAAVFVSTVQRGRFSRILGRDSFADGFHISNGSTDIVGDGIDMVNPGDDGVAVVSYTNDAAICERIFLRRLSVVNGLARGLSVVGGNSVEYHDIDLFRSRGCGIYVAHEQGDFNTRPVNGVRVSNATLREANWDASLDSGAVGLFNLVSGTTMRDVRIAGVVATGSRKQSDGSSYALIKNAAGAGGRFAGCVYQDITLDKGSGTAGQVYVDNSITAGVVANGSEKYVTATGTGVAQNAEGYVIYGNATLGTAGSTAAAPDITVTRVRTALTV